MARKASYPLWVEKHLSKGIYVNKVGDCYYLYKAHSEKQPGVPYPVRVSDGYLGRVTEKDGLIPSKGTIRDVVVFDFAIPFAVCQHTQKILSGLCKSYEDGTLIYVCSVMDFIYNMHSQELYESSWLSMRYPKLRIPNSNSELNPSIERGCRMIKTETGKVFGEDWPLMKAYFTTIVLVRTNGRLYWPKPTGKAETLAQKYHLDFNEGENDNAD